MHLRMSGLLWPEATHRLANSACVTRERVGRGEAVDLDRQALDLGGVRLDAGDEAALGGERLDDRSGEPQPVDHRRGEAGGHRCVDVARVRFGERRAGVAQGDQRAVDGRAGADVHAHLLRHDSVHGPFPGTVEAKGNAIVVNGTRSGSSEVTLDGTASTSAADCRR